MKPSPPDTRQSQSKLRSGEQARVGIIILVLTSFLLGLAASGLWHFRGSSKQRTASADGEQRLELSDGTKAVLKGLNSSVEIRFYSLLDPASASESMQAFAGRVDQLLSDYQQEAGDVITVKRFTALSTDADAASADGIKPFNMDKGEACYLGITIAHGGQKESLPQIFPEWEQALEFDLARAIARVSNTTTTKAVVADTSQPDKAVVEEVKRAIPDLASVSLEEGTRILRETAMNEFSAAAAKMQNRVKEAQERLVQAQNNSSEAGQQTAMKQFQQVQTEQTEKLKQIAARLQAQITALEQLKRQ